MTTEAIQIEKLRGVHPRLIEAVKSILFALAYLRIDGCVIEGVSLKPAHKPRGADNWGYSVRFGFLINGEPSTDPRLPWWPLLSEMAASQGLRRMADPAQLELPHEFIH